MIEHLFIAEKPSLAGEVANARAQQIGAVATKTRTHWEVGPDAVTWLYGHMYGTAQPQAYDPRFKDWRLEYLPIVPDKWKLEPAEDKLGHIRDIQGLIKRSRRLVNVGDAAREGQLLVDELIAEAGRDPFGPDVLRLWLKDLTAQKKLDALGSMFPNADKRLLYEAALGRQRADWLHGLNMTRLFTGLADRAGVVRKGAISVGRVQTPTLRLVVDRDREIEKFKPVDHYLPGVVFRHAKGSFKAAWIIPPDSDGLDVDGRLVDKTVAERVVAKVTGKTGDVESFTTTKKSKSPPLPYDLSNLQKECSAKFGFTAQKTLDVAQSLYETWKLTSYPRSDSQHLPTGILKDEAPSIVASLGGSQAYGEIAKGANLGLRSPAWNDSKVTDHYGIIPTIEASASKIDQLPADERRVFDLIAKRFLAQFYPDHRWDSAKAIVKVEGERFQATGRIVTEKGWKAVYEKLTKGIVEDQDQEKEKDEEENEDDQSLPAMGRGDPVQAERAAIDSKRTTPPSRFTDGTLVDAMKSIHKYVQDGEAKKRLKETSGIGTTATRANILETLIKRVFMTRKGKFLISSTLGRSIIDILDPRLTDPALTALWEEQLERVEKGELSLDLFLEKLVGEVRSVVERLADTTLKIAGATPLPGTGEICTACGKGRMMTRMGPKGTSIAGKRFLSCDAYDKSDPNSCRHAVWPDAGGVPVPKLEGDGETCPECGKGKMQTRMISKPGPNKGKRFLSCDAYDKNDPSSCRHAIWEKAKIEPLPKHGTLCPTCGKHNLVTRQVNRDGPNKGKRFLSCEGYDRDNPDACKHIEWPKDEVRGLPDDGNACPACGKGVLRTRQVNKDGPNKGKRFLSCDAYDPKVEGSCRHTVWPDDGGPKSGGGRPGGGASAPRAGVGGKAFGVGAPKRPSMPRPAATPVGAARPRPGFPPRRPPGAAG